MQPVRPHDDEAHPPHLSVPPVGWQRLDRIALGLIYGAIVVSSLLMAADEAADPPFEVALILFGSVLAITLAKVFAELLSHAIETGERLLTLRAMSSAWSHAHPTLSVANLPAALFVAVGLGWLTPQAATVLSQAWCILILLVFGARVGWVISRGPWLSVVGALCSGSVGLALAALEHALK